MESTGRPADCIARGILPTARQSFADLFRWNQRTEVRDDTGTIHTVWMRPKPLRNPISLLALISPKGWLFFLMGFAAWTADAFDFHSLSIQQVKLANYFHTSKTKISIAITCTLLLRSVGAAFFGLAADKYGRKWPMAVNMVGLGLLQMGTIYAKDFSQFIAIRSLFGILMGGVYGGAVSQALENAPAEARGLMSGILQQGYAFGYVLAAIANLSVGGDTESWKTVFWAGCGVSIGIGILRLFFPESEQFVEAKKARKAGQASSSTGKFLRQFRDMLGNDWRICLYATILMTWFNLYSHTSQDSYTTFMLVQKQLDNSGASRASILMKAGACVGGCFVGYISQWLGRRRAIIVSVLVSAALIPAWILPNDEPSLSTSGFMIQFFVQGAFGVVPIHLNELSPPQFRSSFTGIMYQIGNMISSPAAQIVNTISEQTFITNYKGKRVEAYGPVMGVATAIIAVGIAVWTSVGPEKRGRDFEKEVAAGVDIKRAEGKNGGKPNNGDKPASGGGDSSPPERDVERVTAGCARLQSARTHRKSASR